MAMIVENILDLDMIGPPVDDPIDQHIFDQAMASRDPVKDAESVAEQLRLWKQSIPAHLTMASNPSISPLPHHVLNMAVGLLSCETDSSGGLQRAFCYILALSNAARPSVHQWRRGVK